MGKKLKIALFCTAIMLSANSLALENIKITKIDVTNLQELTKEYVLENIPVKVESGDIIYLATTKILLK